MPLVNTSRLRFGPFTVNASKTGAPSSVSVGVGPTRFTLWSRTRNAGLSSIDLPGPWSYRARRTAKNPRRQDTTNQDNLF